jgi:tetratricopeptide (TPR) repeat protein
MKKGGAGLPLFSGLKAFRTSARSYSIGSVFVNMRANNDRFSSAKAFALLAILICLIYSNTLDGAWHLDDYHNIVKNPLVHADQVGMEEIKRALHAAPKADGLDRPLAYLSFSLNWAWGEADVTGYHIVNTAIHMATAFFLFLAIRLLFQTPNLKGPHRESVYFVALLSAVLWAAHPIQIQAVTYIVQRMASMAALFSVIAIYCYLRARLRTSFPSRLILFILCGIAYLFAVFSKNNALILPVSLLLLEFVFFKDLGLAKTRKTAVFLVSIGLALVVLAGIFIFMDGAFQGLFAGYENRPFTLYERALTQPRVMLFYLGQMIYPVADRLSISHDFPKSTSIFDPWTTLPAILLVLALIGAALWRVRKNPALSFAILFFFCNHLIESTIIPLEMVFEHRNYLPSLFLFLPPAIAVRKAFDHYAYRSRTMHAFLVISVSAVIIGIGCSTYIRNWDWKSEKSLWTDAIRKAPALARPIHNLAWAHYETSGQLDAAVALYKAALKHEYRKTEYKADTYTNLGSIYFRRTDYERALGYAEKAVELSSLHNSANLLLCNSLGKLRRYEEALARIDSLLAHAPNHRELLHAKGVILLQTGRPAEALREFRQCLALSPGNWRYLQYIGACHTKMGYPERGFWILRRAASKAPYQRSILLSLADNRVSAGDQKRALVYMNRFIGTAGIENAESELAAKLGDPMGLSLSVPEIASLASTIFRKRSEEYGKAAEHWTKIPLSEKSVSLEN